MRADIQELSAAFEKGLIVPSDHFNVERQHDGRLVVTLTDKVRDAIDNLVVGPGTPPTFCNTEQSYTASCSGGQVGADVTRTVAAGTMCGYSTQAAADAAALASATADAIAALDCACQSYLVNAVVVFESFRGGSCYVRVNETRDIGPVTTNCDLSTSGLKGTIEIPLTSQVHDPIGCGSENLTGALFRINLFWDVTFGWTTQFLTVFPNWPATFSDGFQDLGSTSPSLDSLGTINAINFAMAGTSVTFSLP